MTVNLISNYNYLQIIIISSDLKSISTKFATESTGSYKPVHSFGRQNNCETTIKPFLFEMIGKARSVLSKCNFCLKNGALEKYFKFKRKDISYGEDRPQASS